MGDSQQLRAAKKEKEGENARKKLDSFLLESFVFHQTWFNALKDREFDECDLKMLEKKIDCIFETCYGKNYIEDPVLDKKTNRIRRKLLEVSKKEGKFYKFNFSFTFNELQNGNKWVSFLFWTISKKDGEKLLVDESCREYKSFDDFLANNFYPKCFITYPVDGLYKGCNFVNLNCAWSKACDPARVWRSVGDVLSVFGAIASVGLVLSPAGIPLVIGVAGFATTSIYNIFRGTETLVDEITHGGLTNTWIHGLDITFNVLGLLSFGASNAISAVAKSFAESTKLLKCIKAARGAFKFCSISSVALNLVIFAEKYNAKNIGESDYDRLEKYLLISLNFFVCRDLIKRLISDLAERLDKFRSYIFKKMQTGYCAVKKAVKFTQEVHYRELLETFYYLSLPSQLSKEEIQLKNNISSAISLTKQLIAGKIKTVKFIYLICDSMFGIYKQVTAIFQNKQSATFKLFNSEKIRKLLKSITINRNDKQCLCLNKKIEMIENIETSLVENELISRDSEDDEDVDVLGFISSIIAQYDVRDEFEVLQILQYYFQIFSQELKSQTEQFVFDAFKENALVAYHKKTKSSVPKSTNEKEMLKSAIQNVIAEVQKSTYRNNFLEHTESLSQGARSDVTQFVYVFNNWRVSGEISTDVHYEIAGTIAGDAGLHPDSSNSVFISYRDDLAVIKMKENNSVILMFKEVVESDLRGIMIYIPTY